MKLKAQTLSRRMGARPVAEQPLTSGRNLGVADAAVINTVVRRLGFVALQVFNTIQGNLVSHGRHEYAEALNDSLKPLVDMLLHFELESDDTREGDTEVDHEVP